MIKQNDNLKLGYILYLEFTRCENSYRNMQNEFNLWLSNERNNIENQYSLNKISEIVSIIKDFDHELTCSINYIKISSFFFKKEYIHAIIHEIFQLKDNLSFNSIEQLVNLKLYLKDNIQTIDKSLQQNYTKVSFKELLKRFMENDVIHSVLNLYNNKLSDFMKGIDKNDFIKTMNSKDSMKKKYYLERIKNWNLTDNEFISLFNFIDNKIIDYFEYRIGELKYSLIDVVGEYETKKILDNLLYNIVGLNTCDKISIDMFTKNPGVKFGDFDKHISIENAIMEDYNKLKLLV